MFALPKGKGVETLPNVSYEAVVPRGIRVRNADGTTRTIEADTVIVAAGQECNDSLLDPIRKLGIPFRVVGGANDARELDAVRAFDEGLRAAYELAGLISVTD